MRVLTLGALLLATMSLHASDDPRIATGAVEIRTATGSEPGIVIAVDQLHEGQRDGFADAAYVYSTEAAVPAIRRVFETAVIEDFGNRLIVSAGATRIVFALIDAKARKSGYTEVFADGIGIARYTQKHVETMRVGADADPSLVGCDGQDSGACYSDWSLGGGGSGVNCPSGGAGATSCTSSCPGFSCSVSCNAPYYACCSCMYCKCVR
ncbi:MAG: hypothetical protein M3Q69_09690 [Acidobacteriota bacterium]|nr:hypothetical protein [Acidobacteriota bacterium]